MSILGGAARACAIGGSRSIGAIGAASMIFGVDKAWSAKREISGRAVGRAVVESVARCLSCLPVVCALCTCGGPGV